MNSPLLIYHHILRFMDLLSANENDNLSWLYHNSCNIVCRDTSVIYYDCTNFYFECENADYYVTHDVTGEVINGLRKYGISKENRPNPIVEMGLFLDSRGIPITMSLHPGNTNEAVSAVPLEEEVARMLEGFRFICCADASLGSYNIRKINSMGGEAFIVTQSLKKLSDVLKEAVFNDYDYRLLSDNATVTIDEMKEFDCVKKEYLPLYNDFAYKVIPAANAVDPGLCNTKELSNAQIKKVKASDLLKQLVIVTFSRKLIEYQHTVRKRQIERAEDYLKSQDPEEIKKGPDDIKRYLKLVIKTESGGKAVTKYELDEE